VYRILYVGQEIRDNTEFGAELISCFPFTEASVDTELLVFLLHFVLFC